VCLSFLPAGGSQPRGWIEAAALVTTAVSSLGSERIHAARVTERDALPVVVQSALKASARCSLRRSREPSGTLGLFVLVEDRYLANQSLLC
jgi:hypothetical protein